MKKKPFFRKFGTILIYAFLGTFIAIFVSSIVIYLMSLTPWSADFTF